MITNKPVTMAAFCKVAAPTACIDWLAEQKHGCKVCCSLQGKLQDLITVHLS